MTEAVRRGSVEEFLVVWCRKSLAMVSFRAARATRREMGGEDLERRGRSVCQM